MDIKCPIYIYLLYDPCGIKGRETLSMEEKEEIFSLYETEEITNKLLQVICQAGFLNENGFGNIKEYLTYSGIDAYYYDSIAEKILAKKAKLTLLDVGSYVGDSILQIKSVFGEQIHKIYGFELNSDNCRAIKEKEIKEFELWECGLFSENTEVYFCKEGPFFRMSDGKEGIPTIVKKLDDISIEVVGESILKFDIEGTEMHALQGAREFIRKHRPYIAICVYHKERDILEIPQFLKSIVPEYRFYLRGGMHAVCYAFPEGDSDDSN